MKSDPVAMRLEPIAQCDRESSDMERAMPDLEEAVHADSIVERRIVPKCAGAGLAAVPLATSGIRHV